MILLDSNGISEISNQSLLATRNIKDFDSLPDMRLFTPYGGAA
jgi:hypothetical protein